MVFEAVPANVVQQLLQSWNSNDGSATKCLQRIVHEVSVTNVCPDTPSLIVRSDTRIAERSSWRAPGDRAVGVFRPERGSQDFRVGHFDIVEEAFSPVPAVE